MGSERRGAQVAIGAHERDHLRWLTAEGAGSPEVARSLAAGAVARGRLGVEEAAQLSPCTAAELRAFAPAGAGTTADRTETCPVLSVVVPALDEEANLASLWARLLPVFDQLGDCELVLVDDGSSDRTWDVIRGMSSADHRVVGVRLSRNFGHQAALSAGMEEARGQAVCFMDADLQDPPELLPSLVERWREGYDVVYAVRRRRRESLPKRAAYSAFYRLFRRLADIDVPLDSGDFGVIDRRVVDVMLSLPERTRFLRGLRSWAGFRQLGVPYDRPARHAGDPKLTLRRLVRLALDGLVAFSAVPLRLASWLGFAVALTGGIYIAVAVTARLLFGGVPHGWTSIIAVVLTVGGMQLIVVGVLGEYVARIYDETKRRPTFVVAERTHEPA